MYSPSGPAVALRAGDYEAEVVEVGAGLRSLRRQGYDVVAGYPADQMCSGGRGQLLIPWPNRIEDGSYEFEGQRLQLGLTEAKNGNAIHGLARWLRWRLDTRSTSRARWLCRLAPQPGYPFDLDLTAEYAASADGLHVTIAAQNRGPSTAPYGVGIHPFLTVGRPIDDCELTMPTSTRCEIDERGLPGPATSVEGSPYDFRSPRMIGETVFDNPFGGIEHSDGLATAVLRDPATGRESRVSFDPSCRWLQVFSGETLAFGARESIAVEPMTCPPNAFRSGIDLLTLAPGERHTVEITLS